MTLFENTEKIGILVLISMNDNVKYIG